MRALKIGWVVFLGALVLGQPVWAQVSTSSITGLVQDPSGAVIPDAKVVGRNEATGMTYETLTTAAGTYGLHSLPPGRYSLTVTHPGFKTFTSTANKLAVGAPLVINVSLELGEVAQVVEVQGTYERLETSSATLSDVISPREIRELPLNGRNPLNLIVLEPGLVQRTNNAAGSGTHVFGSRDRAHNVTVDGIEANESSVPNPQSNIMRLNPDNVQEYRVVTHNATPEFGRNSGANVAIATRSGTNEFHGTVFWFHRNTVLNANEWFSNAAELDRPVLRLNQFGASGGGPIVKNKTFFFVSYQGNRIQQTQPIAASFGIPRTYTSALRSGIFRFVRGSITVDGQTVNSSNPILVDAQGNLKPGVPVCGGAVTTNCVATFNIFASDPLGIGIDPAIAALIATFPLPNAFDVGDGLNFSGFRWNPPSSFTGPHLLFRVDHKFNDNNNLFGRFIWGDWDTTGGDLLNSRPAIFPGFPPLGEVFRRNQNLAISYRRVFSPRLVNEFTVGYSRFRFRFDLREANKTGADPPPYAQECFGTDSFRTVDTPFCNTPHTKRAVNTIQFIDNLAYTRGSHNIRAGLNFRFYQHNDERGVPGGLNMSPTIIFDRLLRAPTSEGWTLPSGMNSTDRNNLQNAIAELVGLVARVNQVFVGDLAHDTFVPALFNLGTRVKQFNFYLQDEWRIRPNLSMTYGVRWEINRPPTDGHGRTFVPDRAVDGSEGPVTYVPAKRWFGRGNWDTFAPRVGLAWRPRENTVVRVGYGMAFDTISTFQVTSIGGKVPGGVFQCFVNVQSSAAASAPCTDIPNGIRLTPLLNQFNPFTLGVPNAQPSAQLSPAPQVFGVAPNVGAFDPNLKVPTVHEWSLTIQRELPWSFVGQVGYVGKRGLRLYRAYDLNQIRTDQAGFLDSFLIARQNLRSGCRADGTNCPAGVTGVPPTLLLQLVPASVLNGFATDILRNGLGEVARRIDQRDIVSRGFPANYFRPNPQFSEIFFFDSGGSSSYHGMVAQLRRRFERGLDFGLAWTWSKSIDDMSVDPVAASSGGGLSSTNSRTPTDVRNFRLDRSRSDFDNRHAVVSHFVYELPFGHGRTWGASWSNAVNHALGGWTLTGIYTYQSGEPFTINSGVRTANGFKVSRAELRGPMPPSGLDSVGGITGPVIWNVTDLDPTTNCRQVIGTQSFFCIPEPGQNGMGRNAAQGPSFWNFDFGLIKKWSLSERMQLSFHTEFFNFFNHPNFENPRNATEGSPTLTSTAFGQTCCITSSVPSSSTIIAIGEPNRVIQFGLKFDF